MADYGLKITDKLDISTAYSKVLIDAVSVSSNRYTGKPPVVKSLSGKASLITYSESWEGSVVKVKVDGSFSNPIIFTNCSLSSMYDGGETPLEWGFQGAHAILQGNEMTVQLGNYYSTVFFIYANVPDHLGKEGYGLSVWGDDGTLRFTSNSINLLNVRELQGISTPYFIQNSWFYHKIPKNSMVLCQVTGVYNVVMGNVTTRLVVPNIAINGLDYGSSAPTDPKYPKDGEPCLISSFAAGVSGWVYNSSMNTALAGAVKSHIVADTPNIAWEHLLT